MKLKADEKKIREAIPGMDLREVVSRIGTAEKGARGTG